MADKKTSKPKMAKKNDIIYKEPASYFSPDMKRALKEYEAKQKKERASSAKKTTKK